MLDFLIISERSSAKVKKPQVYPKFKITKSSDLMIRGGDFYAIYDETKNLWSTSEDTVIFLIDAELKRYCDEKGYKPGEVDIQWMWDSDSGSIDRWHKLVQKQRRDNYINLDEHIIWSNTEPKKENYASKCLPYPLEPGSCESWGKLIGTLYSPEERRKLEWAIGSIVNGDSQWLQKFLVLYGAMGTGKSTILNVVQQLFDGYYAVFDAKALGSANAQFALEPFKDNPLVAIQHDGDLSRIEDNTRLNSLVSHEKMTVNAKYTKQYASTFRSFLFMGTNKPVKITDSRSGLLRRLIDVEPSGNKLPIGEYRRIMKQIPFELGAIAWHCKEVYEDDPGYYDDYVPIRMMGASNDFFNFLISAYPVFQKQDGTTLKAAWEMYKTWVEDAKINYPYSMRVFKEELKDYFKEFEESFDSADGRVKNYYHGFKTDKFKDQFPDQKREEKPKEEFKVPDWLIFSEQHSLIDDVLADCPAQYADEEGKPISKWENVKTTLSDLDSKRLHYVNVPLNHIVIDFDIPDENGNKSLALNLKAASEWPKTYAETSKSGGGLHLHYIYTGDPLELERLYKPHIEIKVYSGLSSLRRKLTVCNDIPLATISSGLPLKEGKNVTDKDIITTEKGIRTTIKKCLAKEVHSDTSSNINFIFKVLDDAYKGGVKYDVSDMKPAVIAFASNATNQADRCLKQVSKMKFKSEDSGEPVEAESDRIIFFDVEVFPNLFLVNWKYQGKEEPVHRLINPNPEQVEWLIKHRLIGFNNRRYDNHMLYACLIGFTNEQIYILSREIIDEGKGFFREAYNLSYTDVLDFSSKKQTLKKFEIELGIHHQELGLPWDKPVPEEMWERVAEYCDNDVIATEAVFEARHSDFVAREILAELAGGCPNDTTNTLTTRFIFGNNKNPRLAYTNLATGEVDPPDLAPKNDIINAFPGYEYKKLEDGRYHNMFRGEDCGFGGFNLGVPGMYGRTVVLDVSGMHPANIRAMNLFGDYTARFGEIVDLRLAIKHKDFDKARKMLNGSVAKYLEDEKTAKALAGALKIAVNSVYGLTSARFDNAMRDKRNVNNIVALRGALFIITLRDEVISRGYEVINVKTDSIKIVGADDSIISFAIDFAKKYGYVFEIENIFDRICLVNKSTFIAHCAEDDPETPGEWLSKAEQFSVPYVFKALFSHEDIVFDDMCETFSVQSALYLRDPNTGVPEFVGKVGQFCPIKPGCGGKELLREAKAPDGSVKYDSANGAKGYLWLESEVVRQLGKEDDIDRSYYDDLVTKARQAIEEHGSFEDFVDISKPYGRMNFETCGTPCHSKEFASCLECPDYIYSNPLEPFCSRNFDVSDVVPF